MRIAILLALAMLLAGCASDLESASVTIEGLDGDIDDNFEFDPEGRPTAGQYEANGQSHPDFYNAHDLLYSHGQLYGYDYEFTYFGDTGFGWGFFLASIDGVPAEGESKFWKVLVNGEPSAVGITEIQIQPGDEIGLVLESF